MGFKICQSLKNYFPEFYKQKQQPKRFNSIIAWSSPNHSRNGIDKSVKPRDDSEATTIFTIRLELTSTVRYLRSKWKNSMFNRNVRSKTYCNSRGHFFSSIVSVWTWMFHHTYETASVTPLNILCIECISFKRFLNYNVINAINLFFMLKVPLTNSKLQKMCNTFFIAQTAIAVQCSAVSEPGELMPINKYIDFILITSRHSFTIFYGYLPAW